MKLYNMQLLTEIFNKIRNNDKQHKTKISG